MPCLGCSAAPMLCYPPRCGPTCMWLMGCEEIVLLRVSPGWLWQNLGQESSAQSASTQDNKFLDIFLFSPLFPKRFLRVWQNRFKMLCSFKPWTGAWGQRFLPGTVQVVECQNPQADLCQWSCACCGFGGFRWWSWGSQHHHGSQGEVRSL